MAEKKQTKEQTDQYVNFVVCKEEYGIPILCVHEIIRYESLTKIPQSPEFVEGVLNLRGQVIPVVNLRKKFGLPETDLNNSTRIIVVDVDGQLTGIVVDEVSEVLQISEEQISPAPKMSTKLDTDFISGMGKINDGLVILLDIKKILTNQEKEILEKIIAD